MSKSRQRPIPKAGFFQANRGTLITVATIVAFAIIVFGAVSASHANNSVALNDNTTNAIGSQVSANPSETDIVGIQAAEGGTLNEPALVWFHADWCTICQTIKPTVRALEKQYDGKVKIVRLNVDAPEARAYVQKYRVRGTPTFVFFDRHGKVTTSTSGWPGEQQVAQAFDRLIGQP